MGRGGAGVQAGGGPVGWAGGGGGEGGGRGKGGTSVRPPNGSILLKCEAGTFLTCCNKSISLNATVGASVCEGAREGVCTRSACKGQRDMGKAQQEVQPPTHSDNVHHGQARQDTVAMVTR